MITSFTTFPIHYPLIILPSDEEWSDLLTASLNNTHMNKGKDDKCLCTQFTNIGELIYCFMQ